MFFQDFALDVLTKATIVLGLFVLIDLTLRKPTSAGVRHRLWSVAFIALLLLPVLSATVPRWQLAILPAIWNANEVELGNKSPLQNSPSIIVGTSLLTNAFPEPAELLSVDSQAINDGNRIAEQETAIPLKTDHSAGLNKPATVREPSGLKVKDVGQSFVWQWGLVLAGIWVCGCLLSLLPLCLGVYRNAALGKNSHRVSDQKATTLFDQLCAQLSIRRRVILLESERDLVPMTWGIVRPIVMVPKAWHEWLLESQRLVLLHELAHVKRFDVIYQTTARITCAAYWFHPLIWYALYRLRVERELACDDCVLMAGERPSSYAKQLLEIAKTYQSLALPPAAAMAQCTGLEQRVRALLDRARSHLPVGPVAAWTILVGTIASATVLAAVRLEAVQTSRIAFSRTSPVASENQIPFASEQTNVESSAVTKIMRVTVVAPDQTPVSHATLTLGIWNNESAATETFETDENGMAEIKIPDDLRIYRLWASAPGYTRLFANWEEADIKAGELPPSEFVFQMIRPVEIGGKFVDEDDQPIAGVAIEVKRDSGGSIEPGRVRFGTWYAEGKSTIFSNDEGRWSLANIPPGDDVQLSLKINHPDFISDGNWGEIQSGQNVDFNMLRDRTAKIVLKKGTRVRGLVTNDAGEPLSDALVVWGDNPYFTPGSQEIRVAKDGHYKLPSQKEGELRITIVAPGYAPQTSLVNVEPNMGDIDFVMLPGHRVEIRIVDEAGQPIPNAYAAIDEWRGSNSLYNNQHPNVISSKIPLQSDDEGVYVWEWAPEDQVKYQFSAKGFQYKSNVGVTAGDSPTTIILDRLNLISGQVTDATGQPVPSFLVIPRLHFNDVLTLERREQLEYGKNGDFEIKLDGQEGKYSLKFEAAGFETFSTQPFERADVKEPFWVQLKRAVPTTYHVVNAAGEPVTDATAVVAPCDESLNLYGFFNPKVGEDLHHVKTDQNGFFKLNADDVPRTLIVFSGDGYTEVADSRDNPADTITIPQWARLNAYVTRSGQPWDAEAYMLPVRYQNGCSIHIQGVSPVPDVKDGHIQTEHLPSMPLSLTLLDKDNRQGLRCNLTFQTGPGEAVKLDFRDGSRVGGQIKLTGANSSKIDFEKSRVELTRLEPAIKIPSELQRFLVENELINLAFEDVKEWFANHDLWPARQTYEQCFDTYSDFLGSSGEFSVDVLRPGKYQLKINPFIKTKAEIWGIAMSDFTQLIEIDKQPLEMGEIAVPVFDDPRRGDLIPDFSIQLGDGKAPTTLSAHRGKYLLLDVYCPSYDTCIADTSKVRKLVNLLAKKKLVTVISLRHGLDPGQRLPPEPPKGIEWFEGKIAFTDQDRTYRQLGAWQPRHFVLIDPEGRYLVGGSFASVAKKISELGLK